MREAVSRTWHDALLSLAIGFSRTTRNITFGWTFLTLTLLTLYINLKKELTDMFKDTFSYLPLTPVSGVVTTFALRLVGNLLEALLLTTLLTVLKRTLVNREQNP